MKKLLFTHTLLLTILFSTSAHACSVSLTSALYFFFLTPYVVGSTIYYLNKQHYKKLSFSERTNKTLTFSLYLLITITIIKIIFCKEIYKFLNLIPLAIIITLNIITNCTFLPQKPSNKIKRFFFSLISFVKILTKIITLLYTAILISFYHCPSIKNCLSIKNSSSLETIDTFSPPSQAEYKKEENLPKQLPPTEQKPTTKTTYIIKDKKIIEEKLPSSTAPVFSDFIIKDGNITQENTPKVN